MYNPIIKVDSLSKTYRFGFLYSKRSNAITDLSLTINSGEIFGFLGPNGSGKTTTLRCILGLIRPDTGRVEIMGNVIERGSNLFEQVGYLPEEFCLFDHLSGEKILKFYAKLYGTPSSECQYQVDRILDKVGFGAERKRSVRGYSKGMKQKLAIAQTLINNPKILFLDEPSRGLDPLACKQVRDVIIQLHQQGTTIFINSHQLSEVEKICTQIGIVKNGRLIKQAAMGEISNNETLEDYFVRMVVNE